MFVFKKPYSGSQDQAKTIKTHDKSQGLYNIFF